MASLFSRAAAEVKRNGFYACRGDFVNRSFIAPLQDRLGRLRFEKSHQIQGQICVVLSCEGPSCRYSLRRRSAPRA
jgi:hypothetical protein